MQQFAKPWSACLAHGQRIQRAHTVLLQGDTWQRCAQRRASLSIAGSSSAPAPGPAVAPPAGRSGRQQALEPGDVPEQGLALPLQQQQHTPLRTHSGSSARMVDASQPALACEI